MRIYDRDRVLPPIQPVQAARKSPLPAITRNTKLVSLQDAAVRLKEDKGFDCSVSTIREYCRSRKWKEGIHWVKPGKAYLINLESVYESIARGSFRD